MDARLMPLPDAQPSATPRHMVLVLNGGSGSRDGDSLGEKLEAHFAAAGFPVTHIAVGPDQDLCTAARRAVQQVQAEGGVVVAAGGDGTVSTVAGFCAEAQVPLGIIPLGTFNYFARHLGIPSDPLEAAAVLLTAHTRSISVGYVNGRLFLNNAAFGLYTRIIRRRETDKARFGRFRLVALLSGLLTALQGQKPFAVRIATDGDVSLRWTSMLFAGRNALQLTPLELDVARCAEHDALAVILLKPTRLRDRLRLMWSTALKDLNDDHRLETFCATTFEVQSRRSSVDVVVDGETVRLLTPLRFRVVPHALQVLVPPPAP